MQQGTSIGVKPTVLAGEQSPPAIAAKTKTTAQVLIVENDPAAMEYLRELLLRESHTVLAARSNQEAWSLLEQSPFVDLVIMELDLDGENGWDLLNRIRNDILFSRLPVLVYTGMTDRETVLKNLRIGVQNFLIKPYQAEKIYLEVQKALETDWIEQLFESPPQVCQKLGISLEDYYRRLNGTTKAIDVSIPKLKEFLVKDNFAERAEAIRVLSFMGVEIGLGVLKNIVVDFSISDGQANTEEALTLLSRLQLLNNILERKIDSVSTQSLLEDRITTNTIEEASTDNLMLAEIASSRKSLSREDSGQPEPHQISREEIQTAIMDIKDFPIFNSILNSFKLTTKQMEMSVEDVVYIIQRDAGLCTQVLTFANSAYIAPRSPVDDIEMAIQLIGLHRLQVFSLTLKSGIDVNKLFTAIDWNSFWIHQVGCALLSQDVLQLLEAPPIPLAYLAGLLHDIGKIIISHLYPLEYNEAVEYALNENISLLDAERKFFSITHEEAGALFMDYNNLPPQFASVTAHHSDPGRAETDIELTALISLTNYLCKKYKVGFSGAPTPSPNSLVYDQPSWNILKRWTDSQCSPELFESEISKRIKRLKRELTAMAPQLA